MPPAVYEHVIKYCHAKLREIYVVVASPIPVPAKKDYGDIDVFVAWEKNSTFPTPRRPNGYPRRLSMPVENSLDVAARLLKSEKTIKQLNTNAMLAIPWPKDVPGQTPTHEAPDNQTPKHIQVDLHLCESLEKVHWMLFKQCHGDIWNILGSVIRPFGLTMDEVGLHIRIPEIEHLDRKKAKILLTSDASEILNFLGLEYTTGSWEKPFASVAELYEYIATCRLFWVHPPKDASDDFETVPMNENGDVDTSKMKSKERQRMNSRPLVRNFFTEFIPACRATGRFLIPKTTRDSVREEAFQTFIGVQVAYEKRIIEFRKECQQKDFNRLVIKTTIPEGWGDEKKKGARSVAATAFKKIIMSNDYSLGVRPSVPLRDRHGIIDEDRAKQFILDTYEEVADKAMRASQKAYNEHVAKKRAEKLLAEQKLVAEQKEAVDDEAEKDSVNTPTQKNAATQTEATDTPAQEN